MNLQGRIDLLVKLGEYIIASDPAWQEEKDKAGRENSWFLPEFIELATQNIARFFLQRNILEAWAGSYPLQNTIDKPRLVGIVMAGNIPLVGFHDFLCVFIAGHNGVIKPSSKDQSLIKHLVKKLTEWAPQTGQSFQFAEMLKGCDAYIATGSNHSAGYFEYYFKKYPHIIRRNRTSVAILTGQETRQDLERLADDVYVFFGLGCRNVTKIFVPENYDFIPLLSAFRKYDYLAEYHKYKNNYDYNLTILILNKKYYMSNASILLVEGASPFSPISQLNYEHYKDREALIAALKFDSMIQCIVGEKFVPFGNSQNPAINDYADGVDTLYFLVNL